MARAPEHALFERVHRPEPGVRFHAPVPAGNGGAGFRSFKITVLSGRGVAVTYDEYFRDILNQILASHRKISELEDRPGDLAVINKEIIRITALFRAITSRVGGSKNPRPGHVELSTLAEDYVETYSFEHEIRMMAPAYSGDTHRIRNIRLKILESFEERKLVGRIGHIMGDLE